MKIKPTSNISSQGAGDEVLWCSIGGDIFVQFEIQNIVLDTLHVGCQLHHLLVDVLNTLSSLGGQVVNFSVDCVDIIPKT